MKPSEPATGPVPRRKGKDAGKWLPFAVVFILILVNVPSRVALLFLLVVIVAGGLMLAGLVKAGNATNRKTTYMPKHRDPGKRR